MERNTYKSNGLSLRILFLGLFGLLLQSTNVMAQGTSCPTATVITANGTFSGTVEETTEAYYTFTFGVAANVTFTLKDLNNSPTPAYQFFEDNVSCSLSNQLAEINPDGAGDQTYTLAVLPNKHYAIKIYDEFLL